MAITAIGREPIAEGDGGARASGEGIHDGERIQSTN